MNIATRVYKQYGKDSIRVIRENPYQLAQDVQGIGFRTADDIALKLGLPHDSIPRLSTGMKFVLTQAANDDGHCFLLEQDLLYRASDILHAPTPILQAAMEQLRSDKDIFVEPATQDIREITVKDGWGTGTGNNGETRVEWEPEAGIPPASTAEEEDIHIV